MNQTIYTQVCDYFDNLSLTKHQDTQTHSVYITGIKSLLTNVHRYIFVFVPRDVFFKGHVAQLRDLKWSSLHTRSLQTKYRDVNMSYYKPKQVKPHTEPIKLLTRDKSKTTYKCVQLPLRVTLLHQEYDMFEYSNQGSLSAAIETYNTIIELI